MPTPAEPAPKTTICWSTRRPPETRTPASTQARPTAAVPWMSSSKVHRRVAVPREDAARRRTGEVLPVQDRLREPLGRAGDVGVDELVVLLAAHPGATQAEVARVVEQLLAVGADVEPDREDPLGVDAGGDRVDRELADRDVDAADAPVADAEDRLGVGGDDQVDVVRRRARCASSARSIPSTSSMLRKTPRGRRNRWLNSWIAAPDGGRVDDRQHLVHVLADQPVEEHLVVVVQVGEEDPLLDVGVAWP